MKIAQKLPALIKQPTNNLHIFVFAVMIFFGLLFAVIIPPMQGADESNQFLRAYQISEGNLTADYVGQSTGGIDVVIKSFDRNVGGNLPEGVVDFTQMSFGNLPFHNEQKTSKALFDKTSRITTGHERKAVAFGNTAAYSPIAYVPSVIGIWIGKLFSDHVIVQFYLARLAGLLVGACALALAVRIMPFGKLPFAVLILLPSMMSQMSIVTADTMTLSVSFLMIATVLRFSYRKGGLSKRDIAILIGLFALLGLARPTLAPMALIALALLRNPAIGRKKALLVAAASLITAITLGALWNLPIKDSVIFAYHLSFPQSDYTTQLSFITHYPWSFLKALGNTLLNNNSNYISVSSAGYFGWADAPLPLYAVVAAFVNLSFALYFASQYVKVSIPKWLRLDATVIIFGILTATAVYMYLFCNAPKASYIFGMQGRYLLPTAPLILLLIRYRSNFTERLYQRSARTCLYVSVLLLVLSTTVLVARYYNLS